MLSLTEIEVEVVMEFDAEADSDLAPVEEPEGSRDAVRDTSRDTVIDCRPLGARVAEPAVPPGAAMDTVAEHAPVPTPLLVTRHPQRPPRPASQPPPPSETATLVQMPRLVLGDGRK